VAGLPRPDRPPLLPVLGLVGWCRRFLGSIGAVGRPWPPRLPNAAEPGPHAHCRGSLRRTRATAPRRGGTTHHDRPCRSRAPGHCPQQPWLRPRRGVRDPARPTGTSDPHGNRHRHSDRHPRRSRRHRRAEPHRFSQRSAPPIYAAPQPRSLNDTREHHRRLLDDGAVHLLARRQDNDVGLLTMELTSPAPRLCPDGQPYIGPTATDPSVRGQGIGHALAHAAHEWAHRTGYHAISVDFEPSNPRSRPFWLGLGFQPTGYRLRRTIDTAHTIHSARSSPALTT
jgi:GNAT superfamily N-acetyltransferase